MGKLNRIVTAFFLICPVFVYCFILAACSPRQQSNTLTPSQDNEGSLSPEDSFTQQEIIIPFITDGAIGITAHFDIRDLPSTDSIIIRQSSFGEFFLIFGKTGSGNIENGVLDLWYSISSLQQEWINAMDVRLFPFSIASGITYPYNYPYMHGLHGYKINKEIIEIIGYREINGNREIKAEVNQNLRKGYGDEVWYERKKSRPIFGLSEIYNIDPFQGMVIVNAEYNPVNDIKLIDNKFENLKIYSVEMEKVMHRIRNDYYDSMYQYKEGEQYKSVITYHDNPEGITYESIFNDDFDNDNRWWTYTIKMYKPTTAITGIKIGNTKDDVIFQFGENFKTIENYNDDDNFIEHIAYYMGIFQPCVKIEFIFSDDIVQQIIYSQFEAK
jgi:hypothetical protein